MTSKTFVWVLPCLVFAGASSAAQDTAAPLPGTLLRVTAPAVTPKPLVGTLVEVTGRELVLAVSGSDRMTVPRAAMTRLEWSNGRRRNTVKGLVFGAVLGAVVLSALNAQDPETGDVHEYALVAVVGAGLGALPGAGIGALVKTNRWADLPVSNLRVIVAPIRDHGLAMGFTWAW